MQTKLRAWRRFYDISQEDMAKQLGIDVRTYINKEHGVTQFKANEMFKIAQILQKDIGDIFLPPPFMEHEDMRGFSAGERGSSGITKGGFSSVESI